MCVLITVTLILITMQLTNGNGCGMEKTTFLKTFGSRPSEVQFYTLLYKNNEITGITEECLLHCKNDLMCTNVIVFYNNSECFQYRNTNDFYSFETKEFNLISDRNAVFFEKKCLPVPENCSSKLWAFERVLNYTLVSNGVTLPGLYTELECVQKCLVETRFPCHSINYKLKIDSQNAIYSNVTQNMGTCHLNDGNDRHTLPNAFRVSTYGNDYIENQCLNISTGEHCFYEEYKNKIFPNTNIQFTVPSKELCQKKCDMNTIFNCYGFSLVPFNTSSYICLLHSEDLYLIGPNSLLTSYNSQYFERSKCLNLTVSCTDVDMFIKYTPDRKFDGRIYMQGYSEVKDCNEYGHGNTTIVLHIGVLKRTCGLIEAMSSDKNRSLVYGYLIIQYNPLIQTQGDRLVKVGCLINKDDQVDNVTLDSTIHLNSSFPDQGEIIIANSTIKPVIRIMIVDPITNMDVNEVQIGQEIQLRVQIEPADGPYDISPGKLWAIGENNSDSILLLDDSGCPVRPNIFPGFIKTRYPTKLLLTSNFLAFKFITSNTVKFKIMIHFCILKCPEVNCTLNRQIRNTDSDDDNLMNDDKNFSPSSNDTDAMIPIEYVIIVNQNISSDRYMDDGRILIAGYDIGRNEVCLDYYLLLGLLILWFVIQLIIFVGCIMVVRKYKKLYGMTYIEPTSALSDTQSRAQSNCSCGTQRSNNSQRRLQWDDHLYIGPSSSIYD
ncbi:uncharacterized protein LOC123300849 [Chrysoperla carnea]|uniref:uncharacterized protein LOC123300849 n=1 Tax=Chrysoperla carnea TaxID=189513 RepID=UPI001D07E519|nr:uncharacterized protein LOC123300849 [Chrysoperla carnea]